MSADSRTIDKPVFSSNVVIREADQPKAGDDGTVLHGSKNQEIENLKRLLANISQRLDRLK